MGAAKPSVWLISLSRTRRQGGRREDRLRRTVALIVLAWAVVLWYGIFGLLVIPYRVIRRGQRKRKMELRHRELLATSTAAIAATTPAFARRSPKLRPCPPRRRSISQLRQKSHPSSREDRMATVVAFKQSMGTGPAPPRLQEATEGVVDDVNLQSLRAWYPGGGHSPAAPPVHASGRAAAPVLRSRQSSANESARSLTSGATRVREEETDRSQSPGQPGLPRATQMPRGPTTTSLASRSPNWS
jgi:hypothetical protein